MLQWRWGSILKEEMGAIKRGNVLIASASIGSGHMQAAKAVQAGIYRSSSAAVTVVDCMDGRSSPGAVMKEAYLKMIAVFPDAYDRLYRWSQEPSPGSKVKDLTAVLLQKHILSIVKTAKADCAVFTHPFPCCAAAYLKRKRRINLPLVAVITDFVAHRLWVHNEVDRYFVANEEVKRALAAMGIKPSLIDVTGIPISPRFREHSARGGKDPVVLVMGGGLGLGAVEKAVTALLACRIKPKIVVVTGSNESLRNRLQDCQKLAANRLKVIGFTDKIPELMAEASLLVTKPGALTCSEAMAVGLPLILFDPIPGQEEDNADYLTRQGIAVKCQNANHLAATVERLLAERRLLADMHKKALTLGRPRAADAVANTIIAQYLDRGQRQINRRLMESDHLNRERRLL
ncbi:MAG: glycosyltransferase [Negativicutes bacterium]|nr:glycosyltransferase [Negativicutes bacterium]